MILSVIVGDSSRGHVVERGHFENEGKILSGCGGFEPIDS